MNTTDGNQGTTFHHNGDYSGNVKIQVTAEPTKEDWRNAGGQLTWTVEVPFGDLRELVLDYLRSKAISELENAEGQELESVLTGLGI